jgi:hypothetical protein
MTIEEGMYIQVKTRDSLNGESVFGTCLYKIEKTGIRIENKNGVLLAKDGVRAIMLGGSGPSAREGYAVVESAKSILDDIKSGTTSIIAEEKAKAVKVRYDACVQGDLGISRPATGVIEL